jgi:hypothetical protein
MCNLYSITTNQAAIIALCGRRGADVNFACMDASPHTMPTTR